MSKKISNTPTGKDLRKEITAQLKQALSHLKELLGDKKFDSRIHKAAKLLAEGIEKSKEKKDTKKKSIPVTKKTGTKKTTPAISVPEADAKTAKQLPAKEKAHSKAAEKIPAEKKKRTSRSK